MAANSSEKSVRGMNLQKRRFKVNCAFCRHKRQLTANNPSSLAFTASRRSALPQSPHFKFWRRERDLFIPMYNVDGDGTTDEDTEKYQYLLK